ALLVSPVSPSPSFVSSCTASCRFFPFFFPFFLLLLPPPPSSTLFPYTTLFRARRTRPCPPAGPGTRRPARPLARRRRRDRPAPRSEEHTSELQSRRELVCRLLLEKKKRSDKYGIAVV